MPALINVTVPEVIDVFVDDWAPVAGQRLFSLHPVPTVPINTTFEPGRTGGLSYMFIL